MPTIPVSDPQVPDRFPCDQWPDPHTKNAKRHEDVDQMLRLINASSALSAFSFFTVQELQKTPGV